MRFAVLLACVLIALGGGGLAVAATTTTTPKPAPALQQQGGSGVNEARGFGSRGFGRSPSFNRRRPGFGRRYTDRRRTRGTGFLRGLFHGLFWGWLLSHFFGGGFPLIFPLLLLVVFFAMTRRARRPRRPTYGAW
jgi:hypothetical protein